MKTRTDFVSNSSSSSFICCLSDNKFEVLLRNAEILTLKEYLKEFGWRDIAEWDWYGSEEKKMQYIEPSQFSKKFGHREMYMCLPVTAKDFHEALLKTKDAAKGLKFDSLEYTKLYEEQDKLKDLILKKVKEALEREWGDEKFCFCEIDDNPVNGCWEDNEYGVSCNEELVKERFDYINSLKPLKFVRVFSNH